MTEEPLHNVVQDSRDIRLKDAFRECPDSLALYRIRTEHAFDAMAGDITYHHSCWRQIIDKRVPEVSVVAKSSANSLVFASSCPSSSPQPLSLNPTFDNPLEYEASSMESDNITPPSPVLPGLDVSQRSVKVNLIVFILYSFQYFVNLLPETTLFISCIALLFFPIC